MMSAEKGSLRALVALTILFATAAPSLGADLRPIPPFDIEFLDENGHIQKGVRCAAPFVNPSRSPGGELLGSGTDLAAAGEEIQAAGVPLQIPVAFHVITAKKRGQLVGDVPDAQIAAQIQVLNDAFAAHGFAFYLASVDRTQDNGWFTGCYNSSTENAIKQALAVDPARTLNIYTCEPTRGILGYAYLPWSIPEDDYRHGVVVLYSSLPGGTAVPYDEGDTVTHEVGHYLGLRHTFDGGCTPPGDEVDDTPAEASAAFDCPIGRDTCPSPGLDPIHNFMDYTDDACMIEFTFGQGDRMIDAVALYKPSLGAPPAGCGDGTCDPGEECVCADDCGAPAASELACSDAFDDDCDGRIDCADSDCDGDPVCPLCASAGDLCSSDDECCSGKCRGKPGQQTCR